MQESDEESDSEILNRMEEEEPVRAVKHVNSRKATDTMSGLDKENPSAMSQI